MSEETANNSFAVSQPARLRVTNICGSVTILPGVDGEIKVAAVKRNDSGNADRTRVEIGQDADGRVMIKTHYDHDYGLEWLAGSRPCKVDYSVHVPEGCSIEARTVSATVNLADLEGEFEIHSVSGNIHMEAITGKMKVETVSGSAVIQNVKGALTAGSVSGRLELAGSDTPKLKTTTVSGNISLETPLGEGPYDFHSVSGNIRLTVPGETGCRVNMSSIGGRLTTDLPVTASTNRHGHKWIEVQGGGVELGVDTISGRFSLEHTGNPRPVQERKTPEERRGVLQRVAGGEISVEEALGQL